MGKALRLEPVDGSFSLRDHIYAVLKQSIMELDIYDPESQRRMDERSLAEQLGISRTPIREAINRLAQEGFVEIQPRRGVFIKRKTLAEVLEMLELWSALESAAARLACQRASDVEIAALGDHAKHTAEGARAELSEYSEANIAFHRAVLALSGNQLMITTGDGLLAHLAAVRRRAMVDPSRAERSVIDHGGIIAALKARQPDLAARRVEAHTARLHAYLRRSWRFFTGEEAAESAAVAQSNDQNKDTNDEETDGTRISDRT
ncbi:MAG: GntR family transcriptional regulator [Pseudomonadota bacterium]